MDGSDGSYAVHKLPNGLIDVCLIYGVDEKTSGSLLRVLDSPGEKLLEKLDKLEVEPYSLAVINASLTHFPHLSSGGLDDSVVSIDTTVDEKELGVSWDVVRTLQKFFYPEGAFIEVTDKQPHPSTMSLVLTDILGVRTYCTGLRFYRPFVVVENGSQYRLEPCSSKSHDADTKLVYVPTCAVFKSVTPHYNMQKELLSSLLYNLAQEDDLKFWEVLTKFVKKLFLIPVPPPGRLCIGVLVLAIPSLTTSVDPPCIYSINHHEWLSLGESSMSGPNSPKSLPISSAGETSKGEFSLENYSGSISPPLSEFVNLDIRLHYPFLSLSLDHVLEVIGAFVSEQRILFISTSYTLLTYNIECFLHYISPFEWRSTYVPVLPTDKMGLLDAPGIFLYGCHSANVNSDIFSTVEDLVLVDLDKDEINMVNFLENVPKMPTRVCEDFKKSYRQLKRWYELEEADNPMPLPATLSAQHRREYERRHDTELLGLFLNLMVDLFGGIAHYLCSGNLRYEECPVYKHADKETQEFYKVALKTDLFSLLVHTRKDSTTRDSFTRLSEKKRRRRVAEIPVKQRSAEEVPVASRSQSLINISRHNSCQPNTSPGGHTETFSFGQRKISTTSFKSSDQMRQFHHSSSDSDVPTDITSSCDPSLFYKVKLPSLCGEVVPEKFYESLIDITSAVIKENTATTDWMAPALYLRACLFIAVGDLHKGFIDFATLDKHSVQLMPSQRMLDGILATLPKQVTVNLKSQDFWPVFSRHPKGFSRQSSHRVPDVTNKLPNKPLRNDLFLKTVQKNKLVPDADSANRLYYLLVNNLPAVSPDVFETFYTSYKLIEDNLNKELVDVSLLPTILQFKHTERILAALTSSELKTSSGSGHVILTTCRVLVRSCLNLLPICDLTHNMKVEKQDNVNVFGQGQPHIIFLLQDKKDATQQQQQQHVVRAHFHKNVKKPNQPYIIFNDKTTRETWLKMILEMQIGLLLAKTKKDLQFIKQAESNIIILATLLNSNLKCKTVVQKQPHRILHLSTAKDKKTESGQVAVEESLLYRINPSLNQVSKATIECSLYVPPDPDSLACDCGTGKLWLGLGTGLLRVYDSEHYFLESDTKITDTRQRTGARLSSFLLVDNYVWAGSLYRTIYILDSDTCTVVSKLSNLEDDPSVLALGKLDYQKVVWSLLIKGIVIAWNPFTRERVMKIQLEISGIPKHHSLICYTMAVTEDHLWIGTNVDKVIVLKVENDNRWSVAKEVSVESGKHENQIKCVTISSCGLVWCGTKGPSYLTVFDAKTFQKKCTYKTLLENKPINVILTVKGQVWCGTKDGKILIFEDKDTEELEPLKTIIAHEDTIRTMLLTENGHIVSGSGSRDGSAAIWNPELVKYPKKQVNKNPELVKYPKKQVDKNPELVKYPKKQVDKNPELVKYPKKQVDKNPELAK